MSEPTPKRQRTSTRASPPSCLQTRSKKTYPVVEVPLKRRDTPRTTNTPVDANRTPPKTPRGKQQLKKIVFDNATANTSMEMERDDEERGKENWDPSGVAVAEEEETREIQQAGKPSFFVPPSPSQSQRVVERTRLCCFSFSSRLVC